MESKLQKEFERTYNIYVDMEASIIYGIYCEAVGGVAFNGDPLPDWNTFKNDPSKSKQVNAWLKVGEYIIDKETHQN